MDIGMPENGIIDVMLKKAKQEYVTAEKHKESRLESEE